MGCAFQKYFVDFIAESEYYLPKKENIKKPLKVLEDQQIFKQMSINKYTH